MKTYTAFAATTAILIALAVPGWCETAANDSMRATFERLELRVRQLEQELARLDRTPWTAEEMIAGRGGAVYLPPREKPETISMPSSEPAVPLIESSKLEVSGFLDGVYTARLDKQSESGAALNQVELDLARSLGSRAEVGLSLWYYDNAIVVGAATIAVAAYHAEAAENEPSPAVSHWGFKAGQFDIPFGLDYQCYCSPDRPSVTQPGVVAATHASWNDVGLNSTLETRWGSLDLFAVRGFETRVWNGDEALTEDIGDDNEGWLHLRPQVSAGGRLNLAVHDGLDCGVSLARGWQTDRRPETTLSGVHARLVYRGFALKGEGIRLLKAQTAKPTTVEGWYAEGMQRFGRFFVLARHDVVNDDETGIVRYYSTGGGVKLIENLECRAEYRTDENGNERSVLTQVVARF